MIGESPKDERRRDWDIARRIAVLEARMDRADEKQDQTEKKLDQILDILRAGKIGAAVIKWLAVLGSTWIAYLALHSPPK